MNFLIYILTLAVLNLPAHSLVEQSPSALNHLSYYDSKTALKPALILIHAFPLNKEMWNQQVEYFKRNYRVITFDIRGLGGSAVSQYTLEFIVDDLITLMNELKIEKAVLGGLSMGGFVALRAIERNPEKFTALLLADTKSEPDSDQSKLGRYKALREIKDKGLNYFIENFVKKSLSTKTQKLHPKVFASIMKSLSSHTAEGVSAALLALTSRTDTTASLELIKVPTLIIVGENDSITPLSTSENLHTKIKGSSLVIIPGAGHLANLENSEEFNKAVDRFLKNLNKD